MANELIQGLWKLGRYRWARDAILNCPSRDVVRERLTELLRSDDEARANIKKCGCSDEAYVKYVARVRRVEGDDDALLAEHYLKEGTVYP